MVKKRNRKLLSILVPLLLCIAGNVSAVPMKHGLDGNKDLDLALSEEHDSNGNKDLDLALSEEYGSEGFLKYSETNDDWSYCTGTATSSTQTPTSLLCLDTSSTSSVSSSLSKENDDEISSFNFNVWENGIFSHSTSKWITHKNEVSHSGPDDYYITFTELTKDITGVGFASLQTNFIKLDDVVTTDSFRSPRTSKAHQTRYDNKKQTGQNNINKMDARNSRVNETPSQNSNNLDNSEDSLIDLSSPLTLEYKMTQENSGADIFSTGGQATELDKTTPADLPYNNTFDRDNGDLTEILNFIAWLLEHIEIILISLTLLGFIIAAISWAFRAKK